MQRLYVLVFLLHKADMPSLICFFHTYWLLFLVGYAPENGAKSQNICRM